MGPFDERKVKTDRMGPFDERKVKTDRMGPFDGRKLKNGLPSIVDWVSLDFQLTPAIS